MARGDDSKHDPRRKVDPYRWDRGAGSPCPSCGGPSTNTGPIHGMKTDYSRCNDCGSDFVEGFRMPPGKSFGSEPDAGY